MLSSACSWIFPESCFWKVAFHISMFSHALRSADPSPLLSLLPFPRHLLATSLPKPEQFCHLPIISLRFLCHFPAISLSSPRLTMTFLIASEFWQLCRRKYISTGPHSGPLASPSRPTPFLPCFPSGFSLHTSPRATCHPGLFLRFKTFLMRPNVFGCRPHA